MVVDIEGLFDEIWADGCGEDRCKSFYFADQPCSLVDGHGGAHANIESRWHSSSDMIRLIWDDDRTTD